MEIKGYSYNITFVTDINREEKLLNYLIHTWLPRLTKEANNIKGILLKKVIEAGGEKVPSEQGVSLALSLDFDTLYEARDFNANILNDALEEFQRNYGEEALFFITLLEILAS